MSSTDRKIFRYFDGQRQRAADPLEILRKLRQHPCDIDKAETLRRETTDETLHDEAWRELVSAARDVFDINPLDPDGHGLTEQESYDVLDQFGEFLDSLKKSTDPKPTLPPSSEPPDSPESTDPANTNDSSACG